MPKIVTVTTNTAIDKVIEVENLDDKSDIESHGKLFPSGKGINVARTVETLGKEVVALGFVGKCNRELFETLNSSLLRMRLIEVEGETRTNVTLLDSARQTSRHIRNPGYLITSRDSEYLALAIRNTVFTGDVVVVSGSLPPGADPSMYESIIRDCNERHALVILDSSNDELRHGLNANPYMIKPNIEELEALVRQSLRESDSGIINAAREITRRGSRLVVVSLGSKGVIVVSRESKKVLKANIVIEEPIISKLAVGSGDALVGAFAVSLIENRPLIEAIRLGVACGAANLLTVGPGVCRLADIQRLLPRVVVAEIA